MLDEASTMALLNPASALGVSEAFNLPAVPTTDVSQEKAYNSVYLPIGDFRGNNRSPIDFVIPNSGQKYISLNDTSIYVRFKIVTDEGAGIKYTAGNWQQSDTNDVVSPISNILGSLFSSSELYLNNVSVSSPILNSHCYIDYLKKLLNYSQNSKKIYPFLRGIWSR